MIGGGDVNINGNLVINGDKLRLPQRLHNNQNDNSNSNVSVINGRVYRNAVPVANSNNNRNNQFSFSRANGNVQANDKHERKQRRGRKRRLSIHDSDDSDSSDSNSSDNNNRWRIDPNLNEFAHGRFGFDGFNGFAGVLNGDNDNLNEINAIAGYQEDYIDVMRIFGYEPQRKRRRLLRVPIDQNDENVKNILGKNGTPDCYMSLICIDDLNVC